MNRSLPLMNEPTGPGPNTDSLTGPGPNTDPLTAREKDRRLHERLLPLVEQGILVAFSGGVDSAFLLWASVRAREEGGGRVLALTTTSPSTPERDREDATAFTAELDVEHAWEESREMDRPEYVRNDRERCYHCKVELFQIAGRIAHQEGLEGILYGYNASDVLDDRPGHRAALESGALAPLAEVGLTKPEIRFLMEEAGLPLSGKPASPCLSSRIMTGISITPRRLADVEAVETILRRAGVSDLRVRVCREERGGPFLRVEAPPEEMATVLACREELQEEGSRRGYRWVTLDLGGYRTGGGVV